MPRTLLVVDDDVNVGDFLRESLIERGYDVETHTSPEEALERIISKRFDLVIIDEVPKTSVGKFRKTALREQFAAAEPAQTS